MTNKIRYWYASICRLAHSPGWNIKWCTQGSECKWVCKYSRV